MNNNNIFKSTNLEKLNEEGENNKTVIEIDLKDDIQGIIKFKFRK